MAQYPTYENIELEFDLPVVVVRFNRPDSLNAMSRELQADVIDALDRFEADDEVRAAIITGNGRCFSAGYDLSLADEEVGLTVNQWRQLLSTGKQYSRRIWNFKKPLIAAVHGYCLAGANEIAMLCDLTIASEDARFGEPEVRFGASSTLVMPWIVPPKIAREMLFTGKMVTAERAREIGMVNEVVPRDELIERAKFYGRYVSTIPSLTMQLTKEGINRTYEYMGLLEALDQHDVLTAIMDGTEKEETAEFRVLRREKGLRAALEWLDERFSEFDEKA